MIYDMLQLTSKITDAGLHPLPPNQQVGNLFQGEQDCPNSDRIKYSVPGIRGLSLRFLLKTNIQLNKLTQS